MPAKFDIHTPGPIYRDGLHGEPELLFPAISAGVYGYPKKDASQIAVRAIREYPVQNVKKVIFCCFGEEMLKIYQEVLGEL